MGKQTIRVFFDLLVCSMNYNRTVEVYANGTFRIVLAKDSNIWNCK